MDGRYRAAIVTWLALYPTITVTIFVAEELGISRLPLPVRTLILTAVPVPLMVFVGEDVHHFDFIVSG